MTNDSKSPDCPRWLHALAVLTVLCTLPLLFLGAGVTSHGVGMVDARGFRPPWEIVNGLFENSGFAWRLEYGHRTFGFLVGMCGIGVAVGCFFCDRRGWMGWLGFLALGLICAQGALGIFRVDYNALYGRTFAMFHGAFAQIVFAVLVAVALFTSRRWLSERTALVSPALQRWSIVTMLIVFVQLVLGGLVRHKESLLGPRGHLLWAFVVVGTIVWLLKVMRESELSDRLRVQRILLKGLLVLQLWLGVESWLAKFHVPSADLPQLLPAPTHAEWIRTSHYLLGALLFATTVTIALIANRRPVTDTAAETPRPSQLEGAL